MTAHYVEIQPVHHAAPNLFGDNAPFNTASSFDMRSSYYELVQVALVPVKPLAPEFLNTLTDSPLAYQV
jgi:hypothetical protein